MKYFFCSIILLLSFLGVTDSLACTCPDAPGSRAYYRKARAVFMGSVVHIGEGKRANDGVLVYPVTFKIEKLWKGLKTSEITISTGDVNVAEEIRTCGGFNFVEGEKYLVYAYGKSFRVDICSCCAPTSPFRPNEENPEVKKLNSFWFRFTARIIPFQ
jgi:hypothetical protein